MTRWQFPLRALFMLMTLAAVAVPLVAKYPTIALLAGCAIAWALFESGTIFHIVTALSKPAVYDRHPFLATVTWVLTGVFSIAVSGLFWWSVFDSEAPFWLPLIPAVALALFGVYCFALTWKSFKQPPAGEAAVHGRAVGEALHLAKDVTMSR
jgi:hypothetical protein